jgi:cohesin complex subunit SA-1/2
MIYFYTIVFQAVTDTELFCQDEYLKYLGWMCSDPSETVRRQAIRSLQKVVDKAEESEALQSFVEHFIERFIEIAAGDIDAECSLEMIVTLRSMQNKGLIDFVPEQQLDLVDKVSYSVTIDSTDRHVFLSCSCCAGRF